MSHQAVSDQSQAPEPHSSPSGPSERTADYSDLSATENKDDAALVLGLNKLDIRDPSLNHNEVASDIEARATAAYDKPPGESEQGTATGEPITEEDRIFAHERQVVSQYLLENVAEFRELSEIRLKGWNNPEGDRYFERQRHIADNPDDNTSKIFLGMMQRVGAKMQDATGVFTLSSKRPSMLALGCAPGGFVETALKVNRDVQIIGITLPAKDNGVECLVKHRRLRLIEADVTMLGADLGITEADIPPEHPDAKNFLPRQIRPRQQFDLVTCEGGVLRTHQVASYREHREAARLKTSQLAIALARVKPGGSMVVLMHRAESRNSLYLFHIFSKFGKVCLFKPDFEHQHRSSFYMIVTNIQSQDEAAQRAVKQWTSEWKAATFCTEEEYREWLRSNTVDLNELLEEFGKEWVELSREVWNLQIKGLQRKSFTK
ncbi:hypothetical protein SLS53_003885 [Cytospora paraplurivora]|uniref:Ribosomal RNA methyltransferase FtsJ domain-containing protein n=1 Tax=Cytospora paraplurivora TaxID=2898453 RepID=A0AAN9YBR8_9PEZI